jgi:hypothetical protein
VLFTEFIPSQRPSEYSFEKLDVWVRILNLPFTMMNNQRGKELAGRIGKVGKMDVDDTGRAWGEYLRFRASIKVSEPLMRCVSVFSQKRQAVDHFTVMYERLPTFCFSCGLLGHSSTLCPTPGERDADGLLPYHGPRLCVPDDRKKKMSGSSFSQGSFTSDQGSRKSQDQGGPNEQKPGAYAKSQKDKDGTGDVTSPVKPKTRQRKPRTTSGGAGAVGKGDDSHIIGQKRKGFKPRASVVPAVDGAAPLSSVVPSGTLVIATTVLPASVDSGEALEASSDTTAKKKLRSADPAATAEQSRQTQ